MDGLEGQGRLAFFHERADERQELSFSEIGLDVEGCHTEQLITTIANLVDSPLIDIEKPEIPVIKHEDTVESFVEGHLEAAQINLDAFALDNLLQQPLIGLFQF